MSPDSTATNTGTLTPVVPQPRSPIKHHPLLSPLLRHNPPKGTYRTRNGKVARLPDATRERINLMLLDGYPYDKVLEQLGEDGKHLKRHNLTEWRKGGYQDWLHARERQERAAMRQKLISEFLSKVDPEDAKEATLAMSAVPIFNTLLDLDDNTLGSQAKADPRVFFRLLGTASTLSQVALLRERLRAQISALPLRPQGRPPVSPQGLPSDQPAASGSTQPPSTSDLNVSAANPNQSLANRT